MKDALDPGIRTTLANNIRALSARRGLPIAHVADLAGVSRSQLFNVLARSASPRIDWLCKVASVLEVEVWALLKDPERPRRS